MPVNARSFVLSVAALALLWTAPAPARAQSGGCVADPDVTWLGACSGGQALELKPGVELFLYLDLPRDEASAIRVIAATLDARFYQEFSGRNPRCLGTELRDDLQDGETELVVRLLWDGPDGRLEDTLAYGVVRVGAWGSPDDEPGGFVLNDPDAPCVLRPREEAAVAAAPLPIWFQHVVERMERAGDVNDVEMARDQRRQQRGRVDNDRRGARATDGDPADVLVAQP